MNSPKCANLIENYKINYSIETQNIFLTQDLIIPSKQQLAFRPQTPECNFDGGLLGV